MIIQSAGDILSPLGYSLDATATDRVLLNFEAVRAGRSVARTYAPDEHPALRGLQEAAHASLFPAGAIEAMFAELSSDTTYSRLEQMAILSAHAALSRLSVPADGGRTLFILSSTKGNVASLADPAQLPAPELGRSAERIAAFFHSRLTPVVVSNACISGVCAQIAAQRALLTGRCDVAVVVGVDELSPFIISGFQSFKALSPTDCHPFSADRVGLNLGEAAATIVYTRCAEEEVLPGTAILEAGAIRNDANHISGPSRTGEGSYRALRAVLSGMEHPAEELAFVNVHGTATPYNDEMESIALDRAGLIDLPVNALKGYYGHTLGTAGVLETLISVEAVRHGLVLGTRGFTSLGVSHPVNIATKCRPTDKRAFVKLLSGFGGCNAAMKVRVLDQSK
jgi:3-oxoacyl-[acyl-carrier-protein] synthase-1